MSLSDIGIFTLNWQKPKITIDCVQSLLKAGADPLQVFIIDNGSQDGSLQEFRRKLPKIKAIPLEENLGYGGGFNAGISRACPSGRKFDFYLITNNDAIFSEDSLEELVKAIEQEGEGNIYHPIVLLPGTRNLILSAGMKSPIPGPFQLKRCGQRWSKKLKMEEVSYLSGCCFLVPRKIFEQLDGIREDFFLYAEDVDFGLRARGLGARIFLVPKSRIYHAFHGSSGRFSPLSRYYIARNVPRVIREHSRRKVLDYLNFYFWGLLGLVGLFLTFRWKAIWAYLRGTADFFGGKVGKAKVDF